MHPTVKPVALVADAIKDCSRRNEIVLDLFGGSGSTLIAAETCRLQAGLIEYDPAYCDTVVTRCQSYAGKGAVLAGGNSAFEAVAETRREQTDYGNGQILGRRRSNADGYGNDDIKRQLLFGTGYGNSPIATRLQKGMPSPNQRVGQEGRLRICRRRSNQCCVRR